MTRRLGFILCALLISTTALAQSSPGPDFVQLPNGGWVHKTHPEASPAPVPPVTPSLYPAGGLTGCDYLNLYTNARSTECIIGTYRVGRVYWFSDVERALVLSVTSGGGGTEIVTVQFLDVLGVHRGGPDHVLAFKNDGTYRPWRWLAENAPHLLLLPPIS